MKRHLLSAGDLARDEAELVLSTAEELRSLADRPIKKLPALRGRTVVNLFFVPLATVAGTLLYRGLVEAGTTGLPKPSG